MPQLSPAPWFMMLCLTWMILLLGFFAKTKDMTFPNNLPQPTTNIYEINTWPWPWP